MSKENKTFPSNPFLIGPVSPASSIASLAFVNLQVRFPCSVNVLPLRLIIKSVLWTFSSHQGSRNFELKIGLDSQVTKYPPTKKKAKKKQKNVVAKTNDIVIYASRCITTFSELSKVFFHFILMKNLDELLNYGQY